MSIRPDEIDAKGFIRLCYVVAKEPLFTKSGGGYARAWVGNEEVELLSGELVRRVIRCLALAPGSTKRLLVALRTFCIGPNEMYIDDDWSIDRSESNLSSTAGLSTRQTVLANKLFWALADEFGYPVLLRCDDAICDASLMHALIEVVQIRHPRD